MTMPVWYVFGLWIAWMLQFVLFRAKKRGTPAKIAPNSRWGMILQVFGYWAIFLPARASLVEPLAIWRLVAGTAFGLVGIWLASAGVRHLGKQWRMVAALNHDHQLVTSGPYRFVRHPIYASMLAMFIMNALLWADFPGGPSEWRSSLRGSRFVFTRKTVYCGTVLVRALKNGKEKSLVFTGDPPSSLSFAIVSEMRADSQEKEPVVQ